MCSVGIRCWQQRRDAYKHEQQQGSEPICHPAVLTYDGASAEGSIYASAGFAS